MSLAFKNDKEYYDSLPKKSIGVGGLLFYQNQLLLVQTFYRDGWLLPGGTVEAEESPLEGFRREMKESLNLHIDPTRLIAVDYIHNRDVTGEYIQFLFEAKTLTESQVQNIRCRPDDYKEFKFVDIEKAPGLLVKGAARRLESALIALQDGLITTYLEDGNLPLFRKEMAFL